MVVGMPLPASKRKPQFSGELAHTMVVEMPSPASRGDLLDSLRRGFRILHRQQLGLWAHDGCGGAVACKLRRPIIREYIFSAFISQLLSIMTQVLSMIINEARLALLHTGEQPRTMHHRQLSENLSYRLQFCSQPPSSASATLLPLSYMHAEYVQA